MVTQTPVAQAKYELLSDVRQPRGKTQIFCIVLLFLLISTLLATCVWIGISLLETLESKGSIEQPNLNFIIPTWLHRARMYAESTKKNQNADRNTTVENTKQFVYDTVSQIIVCYYTIPDIGEEQWNLSPSKIDSNICTHVIVGFAQVINCTLNIGDNTSIYKKVVDLKRDTPALKVMISVGGSNDYYNGFSQMVKNHANRKQFIQSVLNITKTFKFDGLDLDWEFPAWLGSDEHEKIHFAQLIQELRKEFDRSGQQLILTVAVAAPQAIVDQSYFVSDMAQHVDFINLMSYDYHFYVWYYPVTGLNAPLFPNSMESGYLTTLNVNFSAHYWVAKGMPREKIVVGIPTYGHSYKLDNSLNHRLQAPASGFGKLGAKGFVSYSTICQFLRAGANSIFDNDSKVPYAYQGDEWISYDDVTSVLYKAKWILANNFKGAMILSLNVDDWQNTCNGNETFPLIRTISKVFRTYAKEKALH